MADYSAKIAALEDALATGELTVESDGDRITYRSIAELKSALDYFKQQQALQNPPSGGNRPSSTVAVFNPR